MSLNDYFEQLGTSNLTLEKIDTGLKLVVTRSISSPRRSWIRRGVGGLSILMIFFLLREPIAKGISHWTPWILALISIAVFVVIDIVLEYDRSQFRSELDVLREKIKIKTSNVGDFAAIVDFQVVRVVVTTTIPLIRGSLDLTDGLSGRTLSFCSNTPYVQRYHAGFEIAALFDVEFVSDRSLTAAEEDIFESLRHGWDSA